MSNQETYNNQSTSLGLIKLTEVILTNPYTSHIISTYVHSALKHLAGVVATIQNTAFRVQEILASSVATIVIILATATS